MAMVICLIEPEVFEKHIVANDKPRFRLSAGAPIL
jgi:hypothetical protein